MRCAKCNKVISVDSAMHCSFCGADYCPSCAAINSFCDCMGELKYYS